MSDILIAGGLLLLAVPLIRYGLQGWPDWWCPANVNGFGRHRYTAWLGYNRVCRYCWRTP